MEVDSFCGIWTCPFLPASIKNVWLFENKGIKAFCSHSTTEIKTTHPTQPRTLQSQNVTKLTYEHQSQFNGNIVLMLPPSHADKFVD